jgi:hypothetical protein
MAFSSRAQSRAGRVLSTLQLRLQRVAVALAILARGVVGAVQQIVDGPRCRARSSHCSSLLAAMLISPSSASNAPEGAEVGFSLPLGSGDARDQVVGDHPAHRRQHRFQHRDVENAPRGLAFSAAAMAKAAVMPPTVSAIG